MISAAMTWTVLPDLAGNAFVAHWCSASRLSWLATSSLHGPIAIFIFCLCRNYFSCHVVDAVLHGNPIWMTECQDAMP